MEKNQKVSKTVDEYIRGCPKEVQGRLKELRKIIKAAAPKAEEKIAYRMPAYYLNGPVAFFAAFKEHIGLFPLPSGIKNFKAELSPYKYAKGSIQFPLSKPLPLKLVTKIVKFRLAENMKK
jgi:uncharacterized protein YdhG (YjbR/CyaY superfamily)